MNRQKVFSVSLVSCILIASVLLSACAAATPTPTATQVPVVVADTYVIAEGKLEPKQFAEISFSASGKVAEVLVAEGDEVKEGDVIARLENREAMHAEVVRAEQEILEAQQALDDLNQDLETAKSDALQQMSDAYNELRRVQLDVDVFTVPSSQAGMTALEAVEKTRATLDAARAAYEPYKNEDPNPYYKSGSRFAKYEYRYEYPHQDLKDTLDDAQSEFNAAVQRVELEAKLKAARTKLEQARQDYETMQSGPLPNDVALAQARLNKAQASLEVAQDAFNDLELRAPFSGRIAKLSVKKGEYVNTGQAVLTLADFSSWVVKTQDLTEIAVVDIEEGQDASVTLDAVPDNPLTGKVERISSTYEERQGDVTYTIHVSLGDQLPQMRWGMTTEVKFDR